MWETGLLNFNLDWTQQTYAAVRFNEWAFEKYEVHRSIWDFRKRVNKSFESKF